MDYFLTAAALRVASSTKFTQGAYKALTQIKRGPRNVFHDQALWVLDGLPDSPCTLLDLGTGWVHAYSLYGSLTRDDEIHCFDAADNRHFEPFKRTVKVAIEQITASFMPDDHKEKASRRGKEVLKCRDFDTAYKILNIKYCAVANGISEYPANTFDRIYNIDVLEHVQRSAFPKLAQIWHTILKPGGNFRAQVGLDDHLAFYQGQIGSKRYLRYSSKLWNLLLQNDLQYINRLTGSEITGLLRDAGFHIESADTIKCDLKPDEVHPDYAIQSQADIQSIRLIVSAHKAK